MNKPTLPDETQVEPAESQIGHNNPPETLAYDPKALAALTEKADAFIKATDIWKNQDVTSEQLAEQLADQIAGLRGNKKEADEQRKAEKKPHDDAGKSVQGAYVPLIKRYDVAIEICLKKQASWLAKKQAEADEAKRREREAAEAQAAEARRMAMDAEASGTIDDQLAAEAAQKEADKAQKRAAKDVKVNTGSASGAGRTISMRTRNVAEITNIRHLFMHFQDRPEVRDVLQRLANAEVGRKDFAGTIPGVEIKTVRTAA